MKTVLGMLAILVLAGCAARPESIPAADVSPLMYKDLACDEIELEWHHVQARKEALYTRQKGNRTRDGLLNALVIPGLGAVTSDHETEIAEVKGKIEVLERRMRQCDN